MENEQIDLPCEQEARFFNHVDNLLMCFSLMAALNSLPANIFANLISCVSNFRRKSSESASIGFAFMFAIFRLENQSSIENVIKKQFDNSFGEIQTDSTMIL